MFDQLAQVPSLPSPKLVFVHIISPHPPMVFKADGSFISLGEFGQLLVSKANPLKFEPVAALDVGTLKAENGEPLLNYPCWAAPISAHGLLYVRGRYAHQSAAGE